MGPANKLNYLLIHLASVLSKQSDQILQEQLGIGLSQYRILMVLEWNPRVQQKAIADSLGQTEASISRQVKLLMSKGLLTSKQDQLNKRKHVSAPTPYGMQITEAATNLLRRNFSIDFVSIGDERILKINSELTKLHSLICKPGKIGACDHQLSF
jgi:DNA-binding MarR family transcriptional regulator